MWVVDDLCSEISFASVIIVIGEFRAGFLGILGKGNTQLSANFQEVESTL